MPKVNIRGIYPPGILPVDEAGYPPVLPSTPGAGQDQQAIRWDNALGAFEFFTPGGVSTGRVVVATAEAIALASSYELFTPPMGGGGRFLRLRRSKIWDTARGDAIASPPAGWAWLNSAKLDSADTDTTTADSLYVDHGAVASTWTPASQTSPVLYKTYTPTPGVSQEWIARINSDAATNGNVASLIVIADNAHGNFARIGVGQVSGSVVVSGRIGANTGTAGITSGQRDAGVWLRIARDGTDLWIYYNTANTAVPPTSWTRLPVNGAAALAAGHTTVKAGIAMQANNTADDHTANIAHWDDEGVRVGEYQALDYLYSTEQLDSTTPAQQVIDDWDLGSDAPTLTQAALRLILADLENTLPDDSATVTWSVVQSATVGASSGAYQAAGSVVVSGTGRYLSAWVKISSSGTTQGSIGPFPFTLPVD